MSSEPLGSQIEQIIQSRVASKLRRIREVLEEAEKALPSSAIAQTPRGIWGPHCEGRLFAEYLSEPTRMKLMAVAVDRHVRGKSRRHIERTHGFNVSFQGKMTDQVLARYDRMVVNGVLPDVRAMTPELLDVLTKIGIISATETLYPYFQKRHSVGMPLRCGVPSGLARDGDADDEMTVDRSSRPIPSPASSG
jgi:hypothetical protein